MTAMRTAAVSQWRGHPLQARSWYQWNLCLCFLAVAVNLTVCGGRDGQCTDHAV